MESVKYYIISRQCNNKLCTQYIICETGDIELANKYYCNGNSYMSDGYSWITVMKIIDLGEIDSKSAALIKKRTNYIDPNYIPEMLLENNL